LILLKKFTFLTYKKYKKPLEVNTMFGYFGPGFLYGAWSCGGGCGGLSGYGCF
jgi:hypothetical protein